MHSQQQQHVPRACSMHAGGAAAHRAAMAALNCCVSSVRLRLRLLQALLMSAASMSTPVMLRTRQPIASASVSSPSLQPTSSTSAPRNQDGSSAWRMASSSAAGRGQAAAQVEKPGQQRGPFACRRLLRPGMHTLACRHTRHSSSTPGVTHLEPGVLKANRLEAVAIVMMVVAIAARRPLLLARELLLRRLLPCVSACRRRRRAAAAAGAGRERQLAAVIAAAAELLADDDQLA